MVKEKQKKNKNKNILSPKNYLWITYEKADDSFP